MGSKGSRSLLVIATVAAAVVVGWLAVFQANRSRALAPAPLTLVYPMATMTWRLERLAIRHSEELVVTFVATPSAFHAFRRQIEPLDAPRDAKNIERLSWDVWRGMSAILNHPWIPTSGPDAVTVRGFIYDVDTGKLEEVSYPGPMGSIG